MPLARAPTLTRMTNAWLRWASALIPTLTSSLTTAYLLISSNWRQWGVAEMEPMARSATSFADLANITLTADCITQGLPVEGCDPYGRPFQPYVVLPARVLAWMGVGLDHTGILGTLLAMVTVALVIGLAFLIASRWQRRPAGLIAVQVALAACAISPGVILGMERGQIEQLSVALVTVALLSLTSNSTIKWLGVITSFLATAIKYLTVGMFLAFANKSALRQRPCAVITAIAASGLFLIASLPQIRQAAETSGSAIPQTTMSAFGLTTTIATPLSGSPLFYFPPPEVAESWPALRIVGLILFAVAVAISFVLLRTTTPPSLRSPAWSLTIGSAGVLLLPYLLGSSHDYRLIFLIPLVAGAALWLGEARNHNPIVPLFLVGAASLALLTSASMLPTPQEWRWPVWFVVIGDLGLFCVLALGAALSLKVLLLRHQDSGEDSRDSVRTPETVTGNDGH